MCSQHPDTTPRSPRRVHAAAVAFVAGLTAAASPACGRPDRSPAPTASAAASSSALSLIGAPRLAPLGARQPPPACTQAVVKGGADDPCTSVDPSWRGALIVSAPLNNYCHFVWSADGPARFDELATPTRSVQPDCPIVGLAAPTSDVVDPALWKGLLQGWRAQVAHAAWTPAAGAARTTVAVVDSAAWPYLDPRSDTYGHGRLMGRLIADLACPRNPLLGGAEAACPLAIANALAVPQLPGGGRDAVNGGYFGTRGELAIAIRGALLRWQETRGEADRLIINLSLGWERQATAPDGLDAADEAVEQVLRRASCLGALTIAAAGNQVDGQTQSVPFLPAFWESRPAPDPVACTRLRPAVRPDASAWRVRPLVHAVAAIDQHDSPLLTARQTWTPRLVAYGIAGVTTDSRAPGRTLLLSGSSVATAAVSGIAAALWQASPSRGGPDIIDAIYKSGVELGVGTPGSGPTTICLGGPPCPDRQHRASLCGALDLAGVPHDPCTTPLAGKGKDPPLAAPATSAVSQRESESDGGGGADGSLDLAAALQPPCAGPRCAPFNPTPNDQPAVWPQPTGAACPSCVLHLSFAQVTGRLSNDMLGNLTSGLLGPGVLSTTAWLRADTAPGAFGYEVLDPAADFNLLLPAGASRATIAFEFHGVWAGFDTVRTRPQDMPVVAQ